MARLLAYCLEYTEGIEFSRGLCDADEPPIAVRDLTGALMAWIDVGTPVGRTPASGLESRAARRGLRAQGTSPVAGRAEVRQDPSSRGGRVARVRSDADRQAGRSTRAPDVVPGDSRRRRAVHRPRRRHCFRPGYAAGHLIFRPERARRPHPSGSPAGTPPAEPASPKREARRRGSAPARSYGRVFAHARCLGTDSREVFVIGRWLSGCLALGALAGRSGRCTE